MKYPSREEVEASVVKRDFRRFLKFVKVLDPPPAGVGIAEFQLWPHLEEVIKVLEGERLVVWLKARQLGATTLLAARDVWTASYNQGAEIPVFSMGQVEAMKYVARAKVIWENLPEHLRTPVKTDNRLEMVFEGMNSSIRAMPSTAKAGRSLTASRVVMDEADFHEYLEDNLQAVKPTVDAGGQLILISTSNWLSVDSTFKRVFREAPGNGYRPIFHPWWVRPGRTREWYEARKAEALDLARFEREYPESAEQALAAPKALAFFDGKALGGMLGDCGEPVEERKGVIKVWRRPVVGGKYVIGGDLAWGQTGAYSCLVVADWQTGEQVAEVYGRPAPDETALLAVEVAKEYNNAFLGLESNQEGQVIFDKVLELGYRNLFQKRKSGSLGERIGWVTDQNTRPVMLGELEEAVRLRRVVPRCRDAVKEMMTFIRDERGRPGPAGGAYADHVMAWAVLWQMRKHAHFGGGVSVAIPARW